MRFCQDIPWVLACGGAKGEIAIWDTSENIQLEDHFKANLIKGSFDSKDYDQNEVAVDDDGDESFEDIV